MISLDQIQEAYAISDNYPSLVSRLIALGIESYTVDVATEITLFRLANGEHLIRYSGTYSQAIEPAFDATKVMVAIANNIAGTSTYEGFMHEIAKAGVRLYEATLIGDNKRVTYVGIDGSHVEKIPV